MIDLVSLKQKVWIYNVLEVNCTKLNGMKKERENYSLSMLSACTPEQFPMVHCTKLNKYLNIMQERLMSLRCYNPALSKIHDKQSM